MPQPSVLILAPHPDDEVLGCGGAICRHLAQGDSVSAVFLTSGELGLKQHPPDRARQIREAEAAAAARILKLASLEFLRGPDWGVAEALDRLTPPLAAVLQRLRPSRIYLPHPDDGHPDHQASLPLLERALAVAGGARPELLAYEVWTPLVTFDQVMDLTPWMSRKLRALRAHASQLAEFDYVRAIRGLNQYRGALAARRPYAEVFQALSSA
jgi:LmbE family N-acetylglucosaminyl deacetylase